MIRYIRSWLAWLVEPPRLDPPEIEEEDLYVLHPIEPPSPPSRVGNGVLPMIGDHVWVVYEREVCRGQLLGWVDGGFSVMAPRDYPEPIQVRRLFYSYDEAFGSLLLSAIPGWDDEEIVGQPTKAPHLRLINSSNREE